MSFQPISDADPVTVVHIICGVCALTVGPDRALQQSAGCAAQGGGLPLGLCD